MSAFPLVEAGKAEGGNVARCCALLEVSRPAYHDRSKHRPSGRRPADEEDP